MKMSSELHRYIEYLQRQLLTPEAEAAFDHVRHMEWIQSDRGGQRRIASSYPGLYSAGLVAQYEQQVASFVPSTRFETFSATAIFGPIMSEVVDIASDIGLGLGRNLSIASSTSSSPGAFARPSHQHHILFIGPGTSSFCNYWAKACSAIVNTLSPLACGKRMSRDFVSDCLQENPLPLILPMKLAVYHAFAGTLLGFGEVSEPTAFLPYRVQLLQAMEVFTVAHEYGHFVAEERVERFRGSLTTEETVDLETFCDRFGMSICQKYGAKHGNFLAFSGAGPTLLLRGMILGDVAREVLTTDSSGLGEGHPEHSERIAAIGNQAILGAAEDQQEMVGSFFEEFCTIQDAVEEAIRRVFQHVAKAVGAEESE